jgi:phosphorylase kinase alpha/beta subunit
MTLPTPQNPLIAPLLKESYTAADLAAVADLLQRHGTLTITPLPSGLFSAALTTDYSKGTNYHAAWARDNAHVAYAHAVNGRPEVAAATARALARFFRTQYDRLRAVIADPPLKRDVRNRPHVRFDGDTLAELAQDWSHAQNDALGYFVWLYATLGLGGWLRLDAAGAETLGLFVRYFRAIEYWADEDSGHWEEAWKVEASSIGVVVAGLRRLREWVRLGGAVPAAEGELSDLIGRGEAALAGILPDECAQPDPAKRRPYDAALLFLIYPLGVVEGAMAERIIERTEAHLLGPIGVRRYLGDSFYCSDYESLMAQRDDDPTRDYSNDIGSRDALLRPGEEAQWCLFDPILSVIHGRRYQRSGRPEDLRKQAWHFNRSLAQLTADDPPRCRAMQCAELYYTERGRLQTSKSTPLLWTQANLWTALEVLAGSAHSR